KAQVDVRNASLRQLQRELGEAGRRLEQYGEDAGRQRVQRSGVADAMRAGQPPKTVDDRKRSLACALVDIEDPGRKARGVRAALRRQGSPPWRPPARPSQPRP